MLLIVATKKSSKHSFVVLLYEWMRKAVVVTRDGKDVSRLIVMLLASSRLLYFSERNERTTLVGKSFWALRFAGKRLFWHPISGWNITKSLARPFKVNSCSVEKLVKSYEHTWYAFYFLFHLCILCSFCFWTHVVLRSKVLRCWPVQVERRNNQVNYFVLGCKKNRVLTSIA